MPDLEGLQPEKRVVIDTPNKTLDRISGKTEDTPPTPTTDADPVKPDDSTPDDGGSSIRTIPDADTGDGGKDPADNGDDTSGDQTTADTPPVNNNNGDDDDEVDLSMLEVDVDGESHTVADLLQEREALAKRIAEIEQDEFLSGLINHYKSTGNIDAYYEAKGVDWDKRTDLEVIRAEFDAKYADFDPKIKEKIWKREIAEKYKVKDDLSPEELESDDFLIAQELLRRDAKNAREAFKENQKKYQAPERKTEDSPKAPQFDPAAYKQKLMQQKEVSMFAKNKLLPLGLQDGQGKTLGFEPKNTEQIIEMMVDDRKFWGVFADPKSKRIDYTKLAKVYAYAQDPEFYEQSLVNLGRNLHLEERAKEQKQIDDRLTRKGSAPPPKETFAKGFLSAAMKQKK